MSTTMPSPETPLAPDPVPDTRRAGAATQQPAAAAMSGKIGKVPQPFTHPGPVPVARRDAHDHGLLVTPGRPARPRAVLSRRG